MTKLFLSETYPTRLSQDGISWITDVGPSLSYETWSIHRIQTYCESDMESYLYMYRRGRLIGGTYSGNFDTSETTLELHPGQDISFHYTNGDPGALATVTVEGDRIIHANVGWPS